MCARLSVDTFLKASPFMAFIVIETGGKAVWLWWEGSVKPGD